MSEVFYVALMVIGGGAVIVAAVVLLLGAAPADFNPDKQRAEEFNAAIYWAFVTANDGVAIHAAKQALARMRQTVARAKVTPKAETEEDAK